MILTQTWDFTVHIFHLSGSVISRGLKCFTNFSTTWLITSKKGRWVSVACMKILSSIIITMTVIMRVMDQCFTDEWDESTTHCPLQATHTTDVWVCHSQDGKTLMKTHHSQLYDFSPVFLLCPWVSMLYFCFWGRPANGQQRGVPSGWTPRGTPGGESHRGLCGLSQPKQRLTPAVKGSLLLTSEAGVHGLNPTAPPSNQTTEPPLH